VRPAILKMQGKTEIRAELFEATLEDSIENKKQARCFLWANIRKHNDSYSAGISHSSGQGVLPSISTAKGLVIVPEDKNRVEKGQKVQVILLDWSECPLNF
jgi:molybdopterin biosynthesis enzyme